jgi:hypothetical protein
MRRISGWALRTENAVWRRGVWHLRRAAHKLVPAPAREAWVALELLDEGHREWEQDPPADELVALMGRAHHHTYLMKASYLAGNLERASDSANAVISLEREISARWPRHDPSYAVHSAHILLGHVALQTHDLEAAQRRLLAAAQVSGRDPVLRTYGPDLALAQELLERGYPDTVVEYLSAWRKRWRIGRELLEWWIEQIRKGRRARVNKWKYLETRRLRHFLPHITEFLGRGE